MSISRPFAFNSGSTISGSVKFGNLSVGAENIMDYTSQPGGVQWWMGPDEDSGYVIAVPDPTFSNLTAAGPNAGLGFWRSNGKTDAAFLNLSNEVANCLSHAIFNNVSDALAWLVASGIPTTYPRTDYDSDTMTYISGLTTPLSFVQLNLINTFIVNLKSRLGITYLSDAFDILYILAGETAESSLRNLVKRAHDITAINSPIFKPFEGFYCNGSSSYLYLNYNPSTQADNFALDSAAIGFYGRENAYSGWGEMGGDGGPPHTWLGSRISLNQIWARMNTNGYSKVTDLCYDNRGLVIGTRTGASTTNGYRNGIVYEITSGDASSSIPNQVHKLGMIDGIYLPRTYSYAFESKGINSTEVITIGDTFESYLDSLGKSIVYGQELFTSWTNSGSHPFETFITSGNTISSAINSSSYGGCESRRFNVKDDEVYRIIVNFNLVSGSNPSWYIGSNAVGNAKGTPVFSMSNGLGIYTFTITEDWNDACFACESLSSSEFSISYISIKKLII